MSTEVPGKTRKILQLAELEVILNALSAHIALLDARGVIVAVNLAWRQFATQNAFPDAAVGVGLNYLAICDCATREESAEAHSVAAGIRSVLSGESGSFSSEYPCHSASERRWFLMTATPLAADRPSGVVVMHVNITDRKEAEQALQEGSARLASILESAMDAIVSIDEAGQIVLANPAAEKMFVYPSAGLVGQAVTLLIPERLRQQHASYIAAFDRDGAHSQSADGLHPLTGLRSNGEEFPIEASLSEGQSGEHKIFTMILRDITQRTRVEAQLLRLNQVQAVLTGINALIVKVRDRDELFRETCRIAVQHGGLQAALIGVVDTGAMSMEINASSAINEALRIAMTTRLSSSLECPQQFQLFARAISIKGAVVCSEMTDQEDGLLDAELRQSGIQAMAALPLMVAGNVIGMLVLYAGQSNFFHQEEMKLLTELGGDVAFAIDYLDKRDRLNHLAYYDLLTGLANRTLLFERVAQFMRSAAGYDRKLALYLFDLERFKNINDGLGRSAGDSLLKQVAEWLRQRTGDASLLARIGADQFAVIVPDVQETEDVGRLIDETMVAFIETPFRIDDTPLQIAAKAGAAVFPDDGISVETLFRNAEAALKWAKAHGDRVLLYEPSMTQATSGRLTLENQLRLALGAGEFILHYQPKVNLRTGKVTGAEALIRWNDPRTGLVLPGRFIPLLEETGLIHDVGRWALTQAVADYLHWCDAGLTAVRLAVNVSPLQLRHRHFVDDVRRVLALDPRAANGLKLEITESLIMEDVQHSCSRLQAIRAMGVTVAIDDFGTGYSSLSYLAKLPVDALKIDRSFVADMTTGPEGLALVSLIINLGHSLKLKVVAEGVETDEQARLLRLLNCDEMQGFFFSEALPMALFETRHLSPAAAD